MAKVLGYGGLGNSPARDFSGKVPASRWIPITDTEAETWTQITTGDTETWTQIEG